MDGLLSAQLDGELDAAHELEVERHLAQCPACAAALAAEMDMRERVRGEAPYYPAPAALRARIRAAVAAEAPRAPRRLVLPWAAAAALAAVLVLVVAWPRGAAADVLAQQVEADHVRSLQVNHLMDVASTDQHTVKPWFHGRLDYAPPVHDYAAQGFPLIGGRLDFLAGRNVAALVYRHKLHPINAFVWPAAGTASSRELHRDGYTLIHWTRNGMTWWIVSDVDPAALRQFAGLLGG